MSTSQPDAAATSTVVAVLAGGRGSRIGGNKPATLLAGLPLLTFPIRAAHNAGLAVVVVAKASTVLPPTRARVLIESGTVHHPLSGLIAALEHAPRVLAVGCDMPFLSGPMLSWLAAQRAAPALLEVGGRAQPFPSLHDRAELPALRAALAGERSLRSTFADLSPVLAAESELLRFGDPQVLLSSVNTPAELAAAALRLEH